MRIFSLARSVMMLVFLLLRENVLDLRVAVLISTSCHGWNWCLAGGWGVYAPVNVIVTSGQGYNGTEQPF